MISLCSINAVFADTNIANDVATSAINRVKKTQDYWKFTLDMPQNMTSTLWIAPYKLDMFESQFQIAVNNDRTLAPNGNAGFIQYLQNDDKNWLLKSQDSNLDPEERIKYMIRDRFYIRFMQVRNNPSVVNIVQTTTSPSTYYTTTTTNTTNQTRTFVKVNTYTTVSGKSYIIRKSTDNLYRFNQTWRYWFSSRWLVTNFLDQQNRIIYTAPNGRRYGIFRINWDYHFNRDNGSVSSKYRSSITETEQYIDQHNK